MRHRITIGKKLALGITALVVSLLLLGYTCLSVISTLGRSLDVAVNGTAKKLQRIAAAQQAFQELKAEAGREQTAYTIAGMEHLVEEARSAAERAEAADKGAAAGKERRVQDRSSSGVQAIVCSSCHAPSAVESSAARIAAAAARVTGETAQLRLLGANEAERKALNGIDSGVANWLASSRQYLTLASQNRFEDAHAILRDHMLPILDDVDEAARLLSDEAGKELEGSDRQAHQDISTSRWAALVLIGLNLLAAAGALWLVYGITRTLRRAVAAMGDAAGRVTESAGQVSVSSESLAQGAARGAESIEETSATSEEINSMIRRNAESSRAAAGKVAEAVQKVEDANRTLEQMIASMNEIDTASGKISKIIRVIDEIAFQTNILALNAAVEAARAGEAGVSFAVVADEVRNLAQRSAEAARDTAALIEDSIAKSKAGKSQLDQVTAAVRSIADTAGEVRTIVDEVYTASREQSHGIEQIATAMVHIEQVTQSTASSARQNSSASNQLMVQAQAIDEAVRGLRMMVSGAKEGRA